MIDNKDCPASPIEINGFGQYAPEVYGGLTKREHFIAIAMSGLITRNIEVDRVAELSIRIADKTLELMEK